MSEVLCIPGPVTVDADVERAFAGPIRPHYGDAGVAQHRELGGLLRAVMRTEGDVVMLFGPGTAGLEAALASALAPGDEVLVVRNGFFGDRLAEIATALGLRVHPVGAGGRQPARAADLRAARAAHPGARALAVVHHETSYGLVNPVRDLCEVAREEGLLTVVDAVASLGGIPLEVDRWSVDLCVGVANKCLGAPVAVAPVSVSRRAWAAIDDGRPKAAGWYLNLATWRRYERDWGDWHPYPVTMPANAMEALAEALRGIQRRGLACHQARLAAAAARVRRELRALGFQMLVPDEHASPVTTAVCALPGMDVAHYLRWMRVEHGLRLGGGLGELHDCVFRVGHMGAAARPGVVDEYLRATADYVSAFAVPRALTKHGS